MSLGYIVVDIREYGRMLVELKLRQGIEDEDCSAKQSGLLCATDVRENIMSASPSWAGFCKKRGFLQTVGCKTNG